MAPATIPVTPMTAPSRSTRSRAVGYRSVKNFYKALWTHTGLLPSRIAGISRTGLQEELLSSRL